MKFLPFEKITLGTKLTEEEVLERLANYIEPEDYFGFRLVTNKERERPYEGKIKNRKFSIRRIKYIRRNTPLIIGELENRFDRTVINLAIRYPILQTIISLMIYVYFGFQTLINFLAETRSIFFFGIINVILVIGYMVTIYSFNAESTKAKIDLEKLLEAREV